LKHVGLFLRFLIHKAVRSWEKVTNGNRCRLRNKIAVCS
jgi:hypothetical protein